MTSFTFAHIPISPNQVFFTTKHCFAFVNLKPILPGHILIAPKNVRPRLTDLQTQELTDLFTTVKYLIPVLESHFKGTSTTMAIQDGKEAGQTVPHLHVHLVPRSKGDLLNNDDIYDELIEFEKDLGDVDNVKNGNGIEFEHHLYKKETEQVHKPHGVDFEERPPRSMHEMAEEARALREFIEEWRKTHPFNF